MFKNYFVFLWRKTNRINIILFVIFFILFPLIVLFTNPNTERFFVYDSTMTNVIDTIYYTGYTDTNLYLATISIIVFAYIIPLYLNKIFYKKTAVDLYFSLPVKREKMVLATFLYGYLTLIVTWLLAFVFGCVFAAVMQMPVRFIQYFFYALTMMVVAFFTYSISFFFSKVANNLGDAFGLNILIIALPLIFFEFALPNNISANVTNDLINSTSPIFIANNLTTYFEQKAIILPSISEEIINSGSYIPDYFIYSKVTFDSIKIIGLISSFVLGAVFFVLSIREGIVFKGELAGERTTKIYGFKIIYPLFMLPLFIINFYSFYSIGYASSVISFLVLVVCYFIFYFVIKRKIKIDKELMISFSTILVLAIAISLCYKFLIV